MSERELLIVSTEAILPSHSFKFTFDLNEKKCEGFVINEKGHYYGYINRCRHMGITLDWDTNEFYTPGKSELICKTHGATYQPETGECTGGPCKGKSLFPLPLSIRSNSIYLDLATATELYAD
ncbi:MAG: Rieske (2Fe-2S) protein [Nitrospirae bacterium]|nr:Rieske (2Fe-2S) protein [Nitrospirota bacterium]MBI3594806.1 Rieske (2Fe-2S) protein [Nitrospirota bacterium]